MANGSAGFSRVGGNIAWDSPEQNSRTNSRRDTYSPNGAQRIGLVDNVSEATLRSNMSNSFVELSEELKAGINSISFEEMTNTFIQRLDGLNAVLSSSTGVITNGILDFDQVKNDTRTLYEEYQVEYGKYVAFFTEKYDAYSPQIMGESHITTFRQRYETLRNSDLIDIYGSFNRQVSTFLETIRKFKISFEADAKAGKLEKQKSELAKKVKHLEKVGQYPEITLDKFKEVSLTIGALITEYKEGITNRDLAPEKKLQVPALKAQICEWLSSYKVDFKPDTGEGDAKVVGDYLEKLNSLNELFDSISKNAAIFIAEHPFETVTRENKISISNAINSFWNLEGSDALTEADVTPALVTALNKSADTAAKGDFSTFEKASGAGEAAEKEDGGRLSYNDVLKDFKIFEAEFSTLADLDQKKDILKTLILKYFQIDRFTKKVNGADKEMGLRDLKALWNDKSSTFVFPDAASSPDSRLTALKIS